MNIDISSLEQIDTAAAEFASALGSHRVVAFHGEMGAGKTTFIRALCRQLGTTDTVTSPTFAIVNEYAVVPQQAPVVLQPAVATIYHFDCYRLRDIGEALAIGIEDYLASSQLCLIEWPALLDPLLPEDTLHVGIVADPLSGCRTLTFPLP